MFISLYIKNIYICVVIGIKLQSLVAVPTLKIVKFTI